MASTYYQKHSLPEGFQPFLSELVRETLRAQPDDILEFLANYCEQRANGKKYEYESIFVKEKEQRERVIEEEPPKEHYQDITNRAKLLVQQSNQQPVSLQPGPKNDRTSIMDDIPEPQGWENHKQAHADMLKKKDQDLKKIDFQAQVRFPSKNGQNYNQYPRQSAYDSLQQQEEDYEQRLQEQYQGDDDQENYQQYDNNNISNEQYYAQNNNNNQSGQFLFQQKDDSGMNIYQSEQSQSKNRSQGSQHVSQGTSHAEEKGMTKQFVGDLYNSALNQIHQQDQDHDQNQNQDYQQAAEYIDNKYNQLQDNKK